MKLRKVALPLILTLSLVFAANVSALELPVTGKGCWVQQTSLDNPNIFSDVFAWYITDASNMEEEFVYQIKRPLILSFSGKSILRLKEKVDQYASRIVGVVWDYEFGATQIQAEADLKAAKDYANSKNLPFGVVVLASPSGSIKTNGVDYAKVSADFLMPMLYCQWWSCRPEQTAKMYAMEREIASVALLPLINLETTATATPIVLTPDQMTTNYGSLGLENVGFYNVKGMGEADLMVIQGLH